MLVAMGNKATKGSWRPDIWVGLLGAIGSPILVVLAVFVYQFIIYPPERDAEQQKELRTLRSLTAPAAVPRKFTRTEIEVRQQAIRDLSAITGGPVQAAVLTAKRIESDHVGLILQRDGPTGLINRIQEAQEAAKAAFAALDGVLNKYKAYSDIEKITNKWHYNEFIETSDRYVEFLGIMPQSHEQILGGSSRADSAVDPTRSQNITVSCRRSASAGASTSRDAAVKTAAVPFSAERSNGGKELAPMADRGYADADQVVGRQLRQHLGVDIVVAERLLVLFEPQAVQPGCDVHPCLA
jgi:hypothetical protein